MRCTSCNGIPIDWRAHFPPHYINWQTLDHVPSLSFQVLLLALTMIDKNRSAAGVILWPEIQPRDSHLPLEPPPAAVSHSALPSLPSPARQSFFLPKYSLSTHIVPAAYPRTYPFQTPPSLPDEGLPKQQRKTQLNQVTKQLLQARAEYESESIHQGQREPLWLCVNRITRLRSPAERQRQKAVTLVVTHGTSFTKEVWVCSFPTIPYYS